MAHGHRIERSMGPRDFGLLLILSLLWGGSFFFIGVAVRALPPLVIVLLRVCLAATALLSFTWLVGERMPRRRQIWGAFLVMGLLNNVLPFSLIVWGQSHIASGLASILNATTPLFTVVVAHLLTEDEKLSSARLAGLLAGLGGVVLLIGSDALSDVGTEVLAQLAVLAAALSYAFAGVYGRRFARLGVSPLATACGQVSASAVLLLPPVLWIERPWRLPLPAAHVWGAVVALGLVSTAVAYVLYFRLLARAGATNLLLVTFLIPISAILLGSIFLGEILQARHFAGMGLIGLGLAAIDGRPLSLFKKGEPGDRHLDRVHPEKRPRLLS